MSNKTLIEPQLDVIEKEMKKRKKEKDFASDYVLGGAYNGYLYAIKDFRRMLDGVDVASEKLTDTCAKKA